MSGIIDRRGVVPVWVWLVFPATLAVAHAQDQRLVGFSIALRSEVARPLGHVPLRVQLGSDERHRLALATEDDGSTETVRIAQSTREMMLIVPEAKTRDGETVGQVTPLTSVDLSRLGNASEQDEMQAQVFTPEARTVTLSGERPWIMDQDPDGNIRSASWRIATMGASIGGSQILVATLVGRPQIEAYLRYHGLVPPQISAADQSALSRASTGLLIRVPEHAIPLPTEGVAALASITAIDKPPEKVLLLEMRILDPDLRGGAAAGGAAPGSKEAVEEPTFGVECIHVRKATTSSPPTAPEARKDPAGAGLVVRPFQTRRVRGDEVLAGMFLHGTLEPGDHLVLLVPPGVQAPSSERVLQSRPIEFGPAPTKEAGDR